jgi:hypothetical protein
VTREIQPTAQVAGLTQANLRAVVEDMGRGPGWYPSGELYDWYAAMVREAGMVPVSKKRFGMTLADLGYRASIRRFEGALARCWFISARTFRD